MRDLRIHHRVVQFVVRFDGHQNQVFKHVLSAAVNRQFVVDVVSAGGVSLFDHFDLLVGQPHVAQSLFLRFADVFQKLFAHGVELAAAAFAGLLVGNRPFDFFQFKAVDFGKGEFAVARVQLGLRLFGLSAVFAFALFLFAFDVNVAIRVDHNQNLSCKESFDDSNLLKEYCHKKYFLSNFFSDRPALFSSSRRRTPV